MVDTLRSGWITTGPKASRFESDFASFVSAPAALALSSCTGAMHVGLAALGIGPGDVVITTPMTFCSTVHVIEHVGARPLLVDVEPGTLNIDPERVDDAVRHTTSARAIMPVHLYGHPCEIDALLEIADRHRLAVLEDAAHALPSEHRGRLIGSPALGPAAAVRNLVAFSFYATKNITTAEGGMLTGPTDLIEKARVWSLHGMNRDAYKRYQSDGAWYYEVDVPGFKYNMTDMQAALGLRQLDRLPLLQRRRQEIAARYDSAFSGLDELERPVVKPHVKPAWHLYVIRLRLETLRVDRATFIEEMRLLNVGASVHFIPVHLHPFYRQKYGFGPQDFPVAFREYERLVSVPLYPRMSDRDVDDVVEVVTSLASRFRR